MRPGPRGYTPAKIAGKEAVNGISRQLIGANRIERARQLLGGLPNASGRWLRLVFESLRLALAPESQLVASSIGYYTLFSVFPLALLVVALASNWLDPLLAEQRIVEELEFVIPGLEAMLGANLESLARARGPVTGVAAVALVWSASNAFNVITRVMDRIWGTDINHRRSVWRHRTLAVLAVLVASGLLLVTSSAEGTVLTVANSLLPSRLERVRPLTSGFWAIFLNGVLFMLLYYFLPHVRVRGRDVLAGAIAAGILWEGAKRLFLLFIASYLSRSNLIYGSVGAIIAFLVWTYISSLILLFGAYLNRLAVPLSPTEAA